MKHENISVTAGPLAAEPGWGASSTTQGGKGQRPAAEEDDPAEGVGEEARVEDGPAAPTREGARASKPMAAGSPTDKYGAPVLSAAWVPPGGRTNATPPARPPAVDDDGKEELTRRLDGRAAPCRKPEAARRPRRMTHENRGECTDARDEGAHTTETRVSPKGGAEGCEKRGGLRAASGVIQWQGGVDSSKNACLVQHTTSGGVA